MKKFTKFLVGIILGTLMLGTTVFAAEEPIVMYTNATAALYTAPEADASKILIGAEAIEDGLPIFVKDFTSTAFYVVDVGAGVDYYIPMVSLNMFRDDALAADAFDKALADAMAVLASGELGNLNLLGESNNPIVNMPTQSQTQAQTQVPTQPTTPVQSTVASNNPADVLPANVVNATVRRWDTNQYVKIIPDGVTMDMLPHTYGTDAYYTNAGGSFLIKNSNVDPCSVYFDDTYHTLMARMETAHALGYRYVVIGYNSKFKNAYQALDDFAIKYKCNVEWANDVKTTMNYYDPTCRVEGCETQEIRFALYAW